MINPAIPGMPGASFMTDPLDFVKSLWGGMNIPGVVVPTISVDELDKKIADLKAVESWLNLNMNMLHSSIQALEVQRATIATLKAMSATMTGTAKPGEADKPGFMSTPFASAFSFPTAAISPAAAPAPVAPAETARPDTAPSAKDQPAAEKSGAMPDMSAPMANPAAWWNLVQDQFSQAVSNAMASETAASKTDKSDQKAAAEGKAAAKPVGAEQNPAAKTQAAPRSKRVPPKV